MTNGEGIVTTYQTWSIIIQIALVISTIIIAIIAVFGETIRNWFYHPRLIFSVGSTPPFTELSSKKESKSDTPSDCQKMKLKINNKGARVATHCKIFTQEIFKQHTDSSKFFSFKPLTPVYFYWSYEVKEYTKDLNPGAPTFLSIAQIAEKIELSKGPVSNEESKKESEYTVFLCIEDPGETGTFIDVGKGTTVVPIFVCAENVRKPIKRYIEIYWNGKNANDIDRSRFYIKIHDDFAGLPEQKD